MTTATLYELITKTKNIKNSIKTVLEGNGSDMDGVAFEDYPQAIKQAISSSAGGGLSVIITSPTPNEAMPHPYHFSWVLDLEEGETATSYLFINNQLRYMGAEQECNLDTIDINNTCYVFAKSNTGKTGVSSTISFIIDFNYLYGFKISKSVQDSYDSVEYTDMAVNMTPAKMVDGVWNWGSWQSFVESLCRPVMLKYDGTVDYELDHNDQTKKIDGITASDISNSAYGGNAMVEFNKIYSSVSEDENYIYCKFCDIKLDETYHAYPFTDFNGVVKDKCYMSMYDGIIVSNTLRSYANASVSSNVSMNNYVSYASNNGSQHYNIEYWSLRNLIVRLHWLIGKNLDTQAVFGAGNHGNGSSTSKKNSGLTKTKPAFYTEGSYSSVKSFYIENFWGNVWDYCLGFIVNDKYIFTKNTPPYSNNVNDGKYSPSNTIITGSTGNYITGAKAFNGSVIPCDASSSSSVKFCDCFEFISATNMILSTGHGNLEKCGAFSVRTAGSASASGGDYGARLTYV